MAGHDWRQIPEDEYDEVEREAARLAESESDIDYDYGDGREPPFMMRAGGGSDEWAGGLSVDVRCAACGGIMIADAGDDYCAILGGSGSWYGCEGGIE